MSKPGIGFPAEPGRMGRGFEEGEGKEGRAVEGRRAMAEIGEPVSEDHQLSITWAFGAQCFWRRVWYVRTMLGSLRSPARKRARRFFRSPFRPASSKDSLLGSSLRMARKAVGAVLRTLTLYSERSRQNVPALGVPTGLPSKRTVLAPASRGAYRM